MGALEQIQKMKSQGKTQEEMVQTLQDQGISPKAINDAINQSKIKSAVSKSAEGDQMEPSIMGGGSAQTPTPRPSKYTPKTQDVGASSEENYYSPSPQQNATQNQNYYGGQESLPSQQEYFPQEGYDDYSYGNAVSGMDPDTMIEIAEQVFLDKIRKIQKQVEEMEKFRALAETKIMHNEERLKRIESSMDKLQAAILEKVGSYGGGLESIKKEMNMMQDSFSKVLPEFAKHHRNHSKK